MPFTENEFVLTENNVKEILTNMHTNKSMFMNSECMFVEYHDIIKMPWYVLLSVIHQNQKIKPLLKLEMVESLDNYSLLEWYCQRTNRNPLIDLAKAPLDKVDYDEILEVVMDNEIFYQLDTEMNAVNVIKTALKQKLVKEVVIYNETDNKYIRDDIVRLFGNRSNVKFRYGNFSDVIVTIPQDSSYLLSDFNKVVTMSDCNHLNFSSLILPFDMAYNFILNDKDEKIPIVDFDYLGNKNIFKLNYFNACYL